MTSTTSPMTTSLRIYAIVAGAVVLLGLGSFFYVLSIFVIKEVPNAVSYQIEVPPESINPLFQAIGAIAMQSGMKTMRNEGVPDVRGTEWQNKDFSQGISWVLIDRGHVDISISSVAAGNDDSWLNLIAAVQREISMWPSNMQNQLQLSSQRFDACASSQRPNVRDTVCIYKRTDLFDVFELKQLLQSHPVR